MKCLLCTCRKKTEEIDDNRSADSFPDTAFFLIIWTTHFIFDEVNKSEPSVGVFLDFELLFIGSVHLENFSFFADLIPKNGQNQINVKRDQKREREWEKAKGGEE